MNILVAFALVAAGVVVGVFLMGIAAAGARADLFAQLVIEQKRRADAEEELAGWRRRMGAPPIPQPPFVVQDPGAPPRYSHDPGEIIS